ncbi:MAG: multifunctional CCA addition/repair protein [Thiotrichales bacterium]
MQIYLVGGAVRDQLLGRPVSERDWVVVGATPEQMVALGYRPVGKDFPVFLHPRTHEEYALARTERKTAPGYRGFVVHASPEVTLREDLSRRDLTINALARDENDQIIDFHGGLADLKQRVLRHVSPAFAEDPVRILRAARFAARYAYLGFEVAPETIELMRQMVAAGEVDALVSERVWQELQRGLGEPAPAEFFKVLRACGALAVVFPELDRLFGVPQPPQYHPEIDSGLHTLLVLEQAARLSPATTVRFAALLHDLGKGVTPPAEWPSHRGHEAHGVPLVEQLCARLRVPNAYRDLAVLATRYHLHLHRALELTPATLVTLLERTDAFRRGDRFQEFLLACEADSRGRTGLEDRPYPQRAWLERVLEAARGVDVASIARRGLQGEALKFEIHAARVAAVRALGKAG